MTDPKWPGAVAVPGGPREGDAFTLRPPATAETENLFQRVLTFMRQSDEWGTPSDVLRSAEEAGISICTEAERKVLEESGKLSYAMLQYDFTPPVAGPMMPYLEFARAELARRAAKGRT